MAKQQLPSSELISLVAPENQLSPAKLTQPAPAELADLTFTATAADQEISVRSDDTSYVDHWGINE